jgi:hypothetical protein
VELVAGRARPATERSGPRRGSVTRRTVRSPRPSCRAARAGCRTALPRASRSRGHRRTRP